MFTLASPACRQSQQRTESTGFHSDSHGTPVFFSRPNIFEETSPSEEIHHLLTPCCSRKSSTCVLALLGPAPGLLHTKSLRDQCHLVIPQFIYSPPHSTEGRSRGNQQECLLLYEKGMTARMVTTEDLRAAVTDRMRRSVRYYRQV